MGVVGLTKDELLHVLAVGHRLGVSRQVTLRVFDQALERFVLRLGVGETGIQRLVQGQALGEVAMPLVRRLAKRPCVI